MTIHNRIVAIAILGNLWGCTAFDSRGVRLITAAPTPEPTAMSISSGDALAKPTGSIGTPVIPTLANKDFINRQGMALKYIAPGTFTMGSAFSEPNRLFHESQHPVILTKPFYLQATEVTQSQWQSVMGYNPSFFKGENLPVEKVSWNEAQAFIQKLNTQNEGVYRLPTEAEWEYAARAGTTSPFAFGAELDLTQANFAGEFTSESGQTNISRGQTTTVAKFAPNAWGLYDMHGNVVEWVQDLYGPYPLGVNTDPTGATAGLHRVCRGGGWDLKAVFARSADRNFNPPHHVSSGIGFRVAKSFP